MKLTDKRLEKLDTTIKFYACMRKDVDDVIILMGFDLLSELLAVANPFVMRTMDDSKPYEYKRYALIPDRNPNYLAVAYFSNRTGKIHDIREIKEADNAI